MSAKLESSRRVGGAVGLRARSRIRLAVLALPLLLASCVTGGSGATAPTLSSSCQRFYQSYLTERTPAFFATDISGRRCAYTYCEGDFTTCRQAYQSQAIETCEQGTNIQCYIYARGRNISWDGPPP